MNINKNHVIAVLAAIAAYNEVVAHVNGRRANAAKRKYDTLREYTNVLVKRLNDENIRLDDFEKFVMNETIAQLNK